MSDRMNNWERFVSEVRGSARKAAAALSYVMGRAITYLDGEDADTRKKGMALVTAEMGKSIGNKTFLAQARKVYKVLPSQGFAEGLKFSHAALYELCKRLEDWLPAKRQALLLALSGAGGMTAELVGDVFSALGEPTIAQNCTTVSEGKWTVDGSKLIEAAKVLGAERVRALAEAEAAKAEETVQAVIPGPTEATEATEAEEAEEAEAPAEVAKGEEIEVIHQPDTIRLGKIAALHSAAKIAGAFREGGIDYIAFFEAVGEVLDG